MVLLKIVTAPAFLIIYFLLQTTSVLISVALAPFYLVAGGRYTLLRLLQWIWGPNRLAMPGRPTTSWPRYLPLEGSAKVQRTHGLLALMGKLPVKHAHALRVLLSGWDSRARRDTSSMHSLAPPRLL